MKKLLTIAIFLLSDIALASVKVYVRPGYSLETKTANYQLGLSAYEPLFQDVFYDGWVGYGQFDQVLGRNWAKTKQAIGFRHNGLVSEFGATYQVNPDTGFTDTQLFSNFTYTLW